MSELDLIPQDYRQLQRAKQTFKLCIIVYVVLVIAIYTGKTKIDSQIKEMNKTVYSFEQKKMVFEQQQQLLAELQQKKEKLEERVNILHGLRDGAQAEQMFLVIDRAFVNGSWFKKWIFRHDGELSTVNSTEEVDTGYFIIIKDEVNPNKKQAWRLNTHMEISGQAMNHTILAGLVNNLVVSPEINDVKILKTSLNKHISGEVVNFDLAISVNNQYVN